MNLEDVIDPEYGLQQDEWSLTRPKFGKEGQLEVVGWSGKSGSNNLYILMCLTCNQDSELFGEGYFRSVKGGLVSGQLPCGCSRSPRWSKDQYSALCSRKATQLGYTFLGFVGEWSNKTTKIKMSCPKHGIWESGAINGLLYESVGCPRCRDEFTRFINTKPDVEMIDSFFASGAFHPDTQFWRSGRKTKQGYKPYWFMLCPCCKEIGEARRSELQRGQRPCGCNIHRQQEAYINLIADDHIIVGIKFGIANNSRRRVKEQNSKSLYTLEQHSVYTFPDVASCKKAERECKQELECGVVLKLDMPDGYTETTWLYNLEKIEEIYKRNGGILVSQD